MRIRPFGSFAALALFGFVFLAVPWLPAADDADAPPGVICVLRGHKEAVYGVAFSPDGKFVLTASGDPSIKVWQLPDGKEVKTFSGPNGHKQIVLAVAVSPDGTEFATAGADNSAKIWDFPSSKHLREFAQGDLGKAVAASNDGTRIAAGDKAGKVKIWNAADGKLLHDLAAHKGPVTGLAFSPNGQTLVSCGQDTTLRFWNVADGKPMGDFAAHAGAVTGVAYAPGNNAVYTVGVDQTLKFWTLPPVARRSLAGAFKEPITALSLSPDGNQVAAASDKGVRLSNVANGQTVREMTGASGTINGVAVSAGNTFIAAGTADRRLVIWQTKDGSVLTRPVAHGGAVTGVAFNGPGTQLATAGKDGMLRLWTVPPIPERSISQPAAVRSAVLAPDGKHLATGGADKIIRLYKLDNLKAPQRQLSGHTGPVNAIALSADGKTAVSGGQGVLRFWDLAKGEQSAQIGAHTGAITGLAFAPGGNQVLSSSADGSVKLFAAPVTAGKGVFAHAGIVTSATLSPDGTRLLTGCADKQVRLWNLANGQVERTWTGPALGILAVAFSPAGNRVAAGSADKSLTVWESNSNKEVKKLANLAAAVGSVALSPDGKHVAAGLADGFVRVYDLTSGKEIHAFTGPKGEVSALLFTAKGEQLISGQADGSVQARVILPKLGEGVKWKHGAAVHALALSKDGTRIAAGGADKQVKVYQLATGKEESAFATPAEARGLSFNPDGKRLAVAGADGQARIYGTDGQLEEYFTHEGAVNAVVYSADGKRLFTAGADKTARSWMPSLVWRTRHDGAVHQAIYSPRGDRVVSAGADGLVRQWNAADGKLIQAIRAHTGAVSALSLSADGGKLATVGADKTAQVYDLAKLPMGKTGGKELDKAAVTITLPAAAQTVSLSPNGLRIAIGFPAPAAGKETVRLYDTATGKEILDLGDQDGLSSRVLGFLPDNRTLLAAGEDSTARLVDVNVQSAFEVHPGGATAVAYHSNGTQILTGGADKTVKLWTIATGKLDRTFGPLASPITSASFSRDFVQVAATAGKTVTVWETATGKQVLSIEQPSPAVGVSFSPDRTRIATAGEDGRARVWDVATKKELQGFLHDAAVTGIAFHPSTPNLLVTGSADKTVGIHTVTAARIIAPGKALNGLAAAPNATHVLTADGDGKVTFWNIGNGLAERSYEGGDKSAACVAVSRNGQLLAVGGSDKKLRVFAYNLPKVLSVITVPAVPRELAFSSNNQALVAAGEDGSLATYDVVYNPGQPLAPEFGKVLQSFAHATEAASVAFPNIGAVFYSVGADKTVKAWKLASDSPTRNFQQPNSVNALAYDPEGKRLVIGCSDGRVRIYDLVKGALLREIIAHNTPNMQAIYCVAFSPDGKQVISGSIDQTLKLWDAVSGKMIQEFKAYKEKVFEKGHQEAVLSAAFSPDGKQIVSGSMDRTIKVWNVADGNVVRELVNPAFKPSGPGQPASAHPGWVYAVRFVEGGKKIVSAGAAPRLRGYLATWNAASGKLLFGKEMSIGTLFALGVSADGERLVLGTGGSVRTGAELNQGIVMKMPK
jgi:WD40 repeat protein